LCGGVALGRDPRGGGLVNVRHIEVFTEAVRELYQHIGEKLRLARIAAGLSHAELALEHRLSESEVKLIELGEHFVSAALLWEIAITLEISINELFPSTGG
jgi:ribosome-binding protein aMBF1 (putative translation factor)